MPIKNINKLILLCTVMIQARFISAQTPTGLTEDFNDNMLNSGWVGNGSYNLSETNQELNVSANVANGSWATFVFNISPTDISQFPYLKVKMKTNNPVNIRIDLEDSDGKGTNASPVIKRVETPGYSEFIYKFSGKFNQSWPNASTVNPSSIVKVVFFFAPGGSYAGNVQIDDLIIGSNTGIIPPPERFRLNQIGFYPKGPKTAIVVDAAPGNFYVVSQDKQDTVFTGTLASSATWSPSGESVRKADFSNFKIPGVYYLTADNQGYSHEFEIKEEVHHDAAKALMKAFYFQRASTALTAPYAGKWVRPLGHPDNNVIIHNSAASPMRAAGSTIDGSKGWYDAGDYNKYIVNSGISTYTFLKLYEEYSSYYDTVNLNIPESTNNIPDILDENLWNIRWMLKMQDLYDGGVYHKLSNATFGGTVMPSAHTTSRYVVKKTTTAALNFAAVMAQSARIFSQFPIELPGLADSCINAAVNAWIWARKNPNVNYNQASLNNPTIHTGQYDDTNFSDEFNWAAYELYTTTHLDSFYTVTGILPSINLPGWQHVRSLGYYTISHYRKQLTPICDTLAIKNRVIALANQSRYEALNLSAYGVGLSNGDFYWGSSSVAANQGLVNILAFNLTRDSVFYKTAIAQIDYLLGRNATNYSFITGYGDVTPMDLHHRICAADGIDDPIPGLLVGGPNTDDQSDCGASSYPTSTYKAKAYLDSYCSYSTNEIAINWNAPAAYLLGAMEAIQDGAVSNTIIYDPVLPTNILSVKNKNLNSKNFALYPNPVHSELNVHIDKLKNGKVEIRDLSGIVLKKYEGDYQNSFLIDLNDLSPGLYTIIIFDDNSFGVQKFVKE